jgi:amicoumacin kinase
MAGKTQAGKLRMETEIRNRYSDQILAVARQRYGIAPQQVRLLDGFESFMYAFEKDGRCYILRLGHSRRRSPDLIRGEVDWINYLADGGAGVARAVLSAQGNLVELIDDGRGGHFLATAFVKAPGGPAWENGRWTPELFVEYGRLLGRMHRLTKSYQVPNPAWRRPQWDDPRMMETDRLLPPSEQAIIAKYHALMAELRALPQERDGFGLVHQDAHAGNFFVDEAGQITLFDFDDCVYGHFVYDLAMALFYAVTNRADAAEFGPHFWAHLWRGYQQENRLDPAWLALIPRFLKLREIDLYAVIHRSFDVNNITDPWAARFMNGRKARIEADLPYLDMAFWPRNGYK